MYLPGWGCYTEHRIYVHIYYVLAWVEVEVLYVTSQRCCSHIMSLIGSAGQVQTEKKGNYLSIGPKEGFRFFDMSCVSDYRSG